MNRIMHCVTELPLDHCHVELWSATQPSSFQDRVLVTLSPVATCHDSMVDATFVASEMVGLWDRVAEETFLHMGASIGYWRGDIKVSTCYVLLGLGLGFRPCGQHLKPLQPTWLYLKSFTTLVCKHFCCAVP